MGPRSDLVDYAAVSAKKRERLRASFAERNGDDLEFQRFRAAQGEALTAFATFEALSEALVARGSGSGWHSWPPEYRDSRSAAVQRFADANHDSVEFHAWLQWLASNQLEQAQRRAKAAGMRIGLYLDLAVGVAPDGMETWWDPDLVITGARIGAPPDLFNAGGQDWGLAPLSPTALRARNLEPFARDLEAAMRHAGAVRIDHAMGLQRLFWIPDGATAAGGGYVRYPIEEMLAKLAEVSRRTGAVVIGEDLGTVADGFRERMCEAEVQSYRLMLFERDDEGAFLPPATYPKEALACLVTHDLPTLAGWWNGHDIALRKATGLISEDQAEISRREREQDRERMLLALVEAGFISPSAAQSAARAPQLPPEIATAAHLFIAHTPARLMAAQIEDLLGEEQQTNVPGTHKQHPNWRRVLGTPLEAFVEHPLLGHCWRSPAREAANVMSAPAAEHRLQFREHFDFAAATEIIPYLARLGVTHIYASPLQTARAGSTHGYDGINFNEIEPGIGGMAGLRAMAAAMKSAGLHLLLDIVPNHMAATPTNRWWHDVLQWGAASAYAGRFDIDWSAQHLLLRSSAHPMPTCSGKVI